MRASPVTLLLTAPPERDVQHAILDYLRLCGIPAWPSPQKRSKKRSETVPADKPRNSRQTVQEDQDNRVKGPHGRLNEDQERFLTAVNESGGIGFIAYSLEDVQERITEKNGSMTLGSDQYASRFLQQAGIDGIQYPSGTVIGGNVTRDISRGWNYVVFDPSNVQIQEQMLFQGGPVDPMAEEAATFGTWTDFRDYVEAMYTPEERGAPEQMTPGQKDAWYRRTWGEAKSQERQGQEVTPVEVARTEEQRDQEFLSSIQTDEGLRDFLRTLWDDAINMGAERQTEEFGLADEAEAAELARRREAAARTEREAHPLIHASAIAVGMDRELKPSTKNFSARPGFPAVDEVEAEPSQRPGVVSFSAERGKSLATVHASTSWAGFQQAHDP